MIRHGDQLDIDVLAIVRGGGARTDLAAFDTEPVARAIAEASKPVLCGIGHEIDNSVADIVAHASLKTPTACAQFLIERVIEFDFLLADRAARLTAVAITLPHDQDKLIDERAAMLGHRVATTLRAASESTSAAAGVLDRRVQRTISRAEQRLAATQGQVTALASATLATGRRRIERHSEQLVQAPTRAITKQRSHLDRSQEQLAQSPGRLVRREHSRLELLTARLSAVDPAQALRRGYSITTTTDGEVVRDANTLTAGTKLTTRLARGTVSSTVTATSLDNV